MKINTYRTQMDLPESFPAQHQENQPGDESAMMPLPIYDNPNYKSAGRLAGLTALITGGDSGIGRAVAIAFAKEGANVAIAYLTQEGDALETKRIAESYGGCCEIYSYDLRDEKAASALISQVTGRYGNIDVLVNNIAVQHPQQSIDKIDANQLDNTFTTNIGSYFYVTSAALPHLNQGASIINSSSVVAYKGHKTLIDYSATKGAITAFTRSLALSLADQGVRVNAVAPGPIWTPLIPSSFTAEEVAQFGKDVPLKRAGQPFEVAPAYVFLASEDAAYITGQTIHVNGGTITNG